MAGCLYCHPAMNKTALATLSWAVSSADANYPIGNASDVKSDTVAKAIAVTATLRATFGGAQALEGVVVINHNAPGTTIALTNNGGMATQNKVAPNPEDGLCICTWWDLRGVASASATQWNVAITGAPGNVAIGELILVQSWAALQVSWGYDLADRFPKIQRRNSHGTRFTYRIPVRYRSFRGVASLAEDRTALRSLRRACEDVPTGFAFVPDQHDQESALVDFPGEESTERYVITSGSFSGATALGLVDQPVELEEMSCGVSLV